MCLNNESIHRARPRNANDVCAWFDDSDAGTINWKYEAQAQAAAAGELKIAICVRLKEMETRQEIDKKQLIWAVPQIDKIILEWKIEQEQKQIEWLKSLLCGKGEKHE